MKKMINPLIITLKNARRGMCLRLEQTLAAFIFGLNPVPVSPAFCHGKMSIFVTINCDDIHK